MSATPSTRLQPHSKAKALGWAGLNRGEHVHADQNAFQVRLFLLTNISQVQARIWQEPETNTWKIQNPSLSRHMPLKMTKIPPTKQTVWGHFDHFGKLVSSTSTRKGSCQALTCARWIYHSDSNRCSLVMQVFAALGLFPCSRVQNCEG